jgi:surface carbohydrate biosynthesis protein
MTKPLLAEPVAGDARSRCDVLLLCDHKDRELRSLQRISAQLKDEYGLSSAILSINFHGHRILGLRPRIVAVPFSLGRSQWPLNLLTRFYGDELPIVHLNWEQHIGAQFSQYKMPRTEIERKRLYHVTWSEEYRDKLISDGVPPDKIRVCGNPQMENLDFTPAEIVRYKSVISKEIPLDASKKLVFFPMNLIPAMLSEKDIEARVRLGFPRDVAQEYVEMGRSYRDAFVQMFKELSDDPSLEMIVRPHPLESVDQYREHFERLVGGVPANVVLTSKFTVREWIAVADVVGSTWSTVVYDVQCIGKPSFLYTPVPRPSWFNHWVMDAVPNLQSIAAVRDFIAAARDSSAVRPQGPTFSAEVTRYLAELVAIAKPARGAMFFDLAIARHLVKRFFLGYAVRMGYRPGRRADLMRPEFASVGGSVGAHAPVLSVR